MKNDSQIFTLVVPIWIANNFLIRGIKDDIELNPPKLQRFIYFVYATYLQATHSKLFSERFETWNKGPVLPSIYAKFGSYGCEPITVLAKDSRDKVFIVLERDIIIRKCFDTVWGKYKNCTSEELSNAVCREGTAWYSAENNMQRFLADNDIINDGIEICIAN